MESSIPRSYKSSDADLDQFRKALRSADDAKKFQLCIDKRDELLDQQNNLEIRFASIEEVMLEECPQYKEKRSRCSQNNDDEEAQRWARFSSVAEAGAKSKKERLPPLMKVSGLWSVEKIQHYRWDCMPLNYCKHLGTAATRTPDWESAVLKLNQLLLTRIIDPDSLGKSTNPIILSDLQHLCSWRGSCDYKKTGRNGCTLKYEAIRSGLPAGYVYDKYGLIISEKARSTLPASTPATMPSSEAQYPPEGNSTAVINPSSLSEDLSSPPAPPESPSSNTSPSPDTNSASSLSCSRKSTPTPNTSSTRMLEARESVAQVAVRAKLTRVNPSASYREPQLRPRPSVPKPSGSKKGRQSSDWGKSRACYCSATVAPEFLSAIERHHQSNAEDFRITIPYATQRGRLCKDHLLQYANWATLDIERARKRSTSTSAGLISKRRRLSLPELGHPSHRATMDTPLRNDPSKGSVTNHFTRRPVHGSGNDSQMLPLFLEEFLDSPEEPRLQKIARAWKDAIAKAGGLDGPDAPVKFPAVDAWKRRPSDEVLFAHLLSSFHVNEIAVYAQFQPNRPVEGSEFATVINQIYQPDENVRYAVNIPLPSDIAEFTVPDRLQEEHPFTDRRLVSVNITPKYTLVDIHVDHGLHVLTGGAMGCCKLWATWPGTEHNMDLLEKHDHLDEKFLELWPQLEHPSFTTTNPNEVIYLPPGLLHATFTFRGGATPGIEYCSAASVLMTYEHWKREKEDSTSFITSCDIGLRFSDWRLQTATILCSAIKEYPELHRESLLKFLIEREENEGKQCPVCQQAWDSHKVQSSPQKDYSESEFGA